MTLHKTTRLRIVTSGYDDRYVVADATYVCEWRGVIMRWHDRQEAFEGVLALTTAGDVPTDDEVRAAMRMILNAGGSAYAHYQQGGLSGSIRTTSERLRAGIGALTQSVTAPHHYQTQVDIASTLTDDEWLVIACGLAECNRRNRELQAAGLRPGMEVLV